MLGPATAVLLAVLSATGGTYDTVHLTDGGLARGTVVEDTAEGVTLQLPDGTMRHWERAEVARIDYAEQAASVATKQAPPEPPAERAPLPFTLSLGTGVALTSGQVGSHAGDTSDWWPGFMLFQAEAGFRIGRAWTTLVYLDGGGGDVADDLRRACDAQGLDCGAGSARIGFMERYSFAPAAPRTPWVAVGTGWESTGVMVRGSEGTEYIAFRGWEALKLAAGYDFRFTRWFGLGLFAGISVGSYRDVSVDGPEYMIPPDLGDRRMHTWFQLGGRLILFP